MQNERDEEKLMDGITEALAGMEDDTPPLPDEEIVTPGWSERLFGEGKIGKGKALSGFTIFVLTFFCSLLLLVGVMYGVLRLTGKNGALFGSSPPSENLTAGGVDLSLDYYHPEMTDDYRLLVICGGAETAGAVPAAETEGGDLPVFFWVLRIDPKNGVLTVLSLPGETLAGEGTLADAAQVGGARAAAAAETVLGEGSVDKYLLLRHEDAAGLITELGGMEWEFSDRYKSDSLDIPVGRHLLDGETVLRLMADGDLGAKAVPGSADILCALLGQRFTEEAFNKNDSLFQALVSHSSCDISVMDYYDDKKFLRWYLHMKAGCRTIALAGERTEGGIILSEGEVQLAREKLGIK